MIIQNPMQIPWWIPIMYINTNNIKMAMRPPAKKTRYCARSPWNSAGLPIPLLISYSMLYKISHKELLKYCCRHNQKNATAKPTGCCFSRIRIAWTEFIISLDRSNQSDHSADRINQFHGRIKIALDHSFRFEQARSAVTLSVYCRSSYRNSKQKEECFFKTTVHFNDMLYWSL